MNKKIPTLYIGNSLALDLMWSAWYVGFSINSEGLIICLGPLAVILFW